MPEKDRASNGGILVPVTIFGNEPLLLEAGRPIAALDEPGGISHPIARVTPSGFATPRALARFT
jgi:hypothetical protein